MKKTLLLGLCALILLSGCAQTGNPEPDTPEQAKREEIKIGAVIPLSGDFAALGTEVKRGLELAQQEHADSDLRVRLVYEDDQSLNQVRLANAAQKLLQVDRVDAGVTMIVEQAEVIAPFFQEVRTPLLVVWDSSERITAMGDHIFSDGFSTERTGEKMARFAYERLNLRRVAVVGHQDSFSELIGQSFQNKFKELGGEIVYAVQLPLTETDYRTTIVKIKNKQADGVYAPLIPMDSSHFFKQAAELNLDVPLLSADSLIPDVIAAVDPALEGAHLTNYYSDMTDQIISLYEAAFGEPPIDPALVSFGYRAYQNIVAAYQNHGDIKAGFDAIFGPSRTSNRIEKIYRIENGGQVEVDFR